mgnify:CR=1 FL=1
MRIFFFEYNIQGVSITSTRLRTQALALTLYLCERQYTQSNKPAQQGINGATTPTVDDSGKTLFFDATAAYAISIPVPSAAVAEMTLRLVKSNAETEELMDKTRKRALNEGHTFRLQTDVKNGSEAMEMYIATFGGELSIPMFIHETQNELFNMNVKHKHVWIAMYEYKRIRTEHNKYQYVLTPEDA